MLIFLQICSPFVSYRNSVDCCGWRLWIHSKWRHHVSGGTLFQFVGKIVVSSHWLESQGSRQNAREMGIAHCQSYREKMQLFFNLGFTFESHVAWICTSLCRLRRGTVLDSLEIDGIREQDGEAVSAGTGLFTLQCACHVFQLVR